MASPEVPETSKSEEVDGSSSIRLDGRTDKIEDQFTSDQVPTLAIHEKSPIQNCADGLAVNKESALQSLTDLGEPDKVFANGEVQSSESRGGNIVVRKVEEKGHGINAYSAPSSSGQKNPDYSPRKVKCILQFPILILCSLVLYGFARNISRGPNVLYLICTLYEMYFFAYIGCISINSICKKNL